MGGSGESKSEIRIFLLRTRTIFKLGGKLKRIRKPTAKSIEGD